MRGADGEGTAVWSRGASIGTSVGAGDAGCGLGAAVGDAGCGLGAASAAAGLRIRWCGRASRAADSNWQARCASPPRHRPMAKARIRQATRHSMRALRTRSPRAARRDLCRGTRRAPKPAARGSPTARTRAPSAAPSFPFAPGCGVAPRATPQALARLFSRGSLRSSLCCARLLRRHCGLRLPALGCARFGAAWLRARSRGGSGAVSGGSAGAVKTSALDTAVGRPRRGDGRFDASLARRRAPRSRRCRHGRRIRGSAGNSVAISSDVAAGFATGFRDAFHLRRPACPLSRQIAARLRRSRSRARAVRRSLPATVGLQQRLRRIIGGADRSAAYHSAAPTAASATVASSAAGTRS